MEKLHAGSEVERVLVNISEIPEEAYVYPLIEGKNDNDEVIVSPETIENRKTMARALCEIVENSHMTAAHVFALTGFDASDESTFVRLDEIKKVTFLLLIDFAEKNAGFNGGEVEMNQFMVSNVFNPEFLRNRVKGTEQNCVQIEAALAHIVRENLLADVYNPGDVMDVSVDRDNLRYLFALVVKLFSDTSMSLMA